MTPEQAATQAAERAADRLAGLLASLAKQANTMRAVGFRIPELDTDPDGDDPTNAWVLADGRLRIRTSDGTLHEFLSSTATRPAVPTFAADPAASTGWRLWFLGTTGKLRGRLASGTILDIGPTADTTSTPGGNPAPGPPASTVTRPPDPDPKAYRRVYRTDWARCYCQAHGVETGDQLKYGTYNSTHGERKIMFGFNDEQIRADLAGAAIKKVEIRAFNTDAWAHAGITIHWGAHNRDEPPTTYSATRSGVYKGDWPETGWGGNSERWRTIPAWYGNAFRDNQIKGLTIDQPGGVTLYGEIDWSTVEIAISYVK